MLHYKKKAVMEANHKEKQAHRGLCCIYLVLCSVSWAAHSGIALWILCGVCNSGHCMHDTIVYDDVFLVAQSAIV
jgi:hypothetical protein